MHKITYVEPDSIASDCGIEAGDFLVSINNNPVNNIFEYRYICNDEFLTIEILKGNGKTDFFELEKDMDMDLGLEFEYALLRKPKSCKNRCIFCFIDQLPKNMRKPLYFKDDDILLSFLHGNYVTLTQADKDDIDTVLKYKLSPMNISVHATDPILRTHMLKNNMAGELFNYLHLFSENGIVMNFQIVLCKGYNDKDNLINSIETLLEFKSSGSVSIVPAGLTDYREGLPYIEPFTAEDAREVIKIVGDYQDSIMKETGSRFIYLADEFYLKAGVPIPPYSHYDDFPQLENGVGMLALFKHEFMNALKKSRSKPSPKNIIIVTGMAAGNFMQEIAGLLSKSYPQIKIHVLPVENSFFGSKITVSGLLTGSDIEKALKKERFNTDVVLIPQNALKSGETVFLDDYSIDDLEKSLSLKIVPVPINGKAFVKCALSQAQ